MAGVNLTHFASAAEFRRWLEEHHATAKELWVAFYKKSAAKRSLTYAEAVDEALCFGWIDGIIKKLDAERFTHRFSPRRPRSIWSNLNVRRVERLTRAGKMHPAGLAAFAARSAAKTGIYLFEAKQPVAFAPALEKRFRAAKSAWTFFAAQPPGYRRLLTRWVMTAKQEPTRERRLDRLIAACVAGKRMFLTTPVRDRRRDGRGRRGRNTKAAK